MKFLSWIIAVASFLIGARIADQSLGRTIISTAAGWVFVVIIGALSALTTFLKNRKKPGTEETGENIIGDFAIAAMIYIDILFGSNYYFPLSIDIRKAMIIRIYISGGRYSSTHYVLLYTDNDQMVDIYGGLAGLNHKEGDDVSTIYQHGWLGLDVVSEVK